MKTNILIWLDGFGNKEFHVRPVTIRKGSNDPDVLPFEDILSTGSVICLDETPVAWFLLDFFEDYYNETLSYNIRCCAYYGEAPHFEYYLNDNLYQYNVFQDMLEAICNRIAKLKSLAEISESADQFKQLQAFWGDDHLFWSLSGTVQDNLAAVIKFYEDFVMYSRKIMKENPQADLISVSGP